MDLNALSQTLCDDAATSAARLRIAVNNLAGGRVLDFGIDAPGGLEAGCLLAQICMGHLADVSIAAADPAVFASPVAVSVRTDHPTLACLGGQYAGWPVAVGDFFAMGSGPMRMLRGQEEVLDELQLKAPAREHIVGVLETDTMPTAEVIEFVAKECGAAPESVTLAVAPVTSIAGVVQVVARSIETALHKLHAVGMDPRAVKSGFGSAPLPPPATDTIGGIGRTNDAILYGGQVTLWVDEDQGTVDRLGPRIPSGASADHGRPFAEIFRSYGCDFYKVDPHLFSPAVVTIYNLRTGVSRMFGSLDSGVLQRSFAPATEDGAGRHVRGEGSHT